MSAPGVDSLRLVNQNLGKRLSQIAPAEGAPLELSSQDCAELFTDLLLAAEVLRGVSCCDTGDAELAPQISQYRSHLMKLQQLLPSIQTNLLAERARLEVERRHLQAASAWAQASRDSL